MYIIEGNIGAGKSTFLQLLGQQFPALSVALEPLNDWQKKVYGQSLLANFYQQPKRWAYTLETLAMTCRVREHIAHQADSTKVHVVERSIYSGHYCFTKNSYESGFMTNLEWQLYSSWFNLLIPGKCKTPNGFIYLQVDPEIAYERVKKRNRLTEKQLSLAYLRLLETKHDEFLIQKKDLLKELQNVPVLTLNCNKEFETDLEQRELLFAQVQEFIEKTKLESWRAPAPAQKEKTTSL